MKLRAVGLFARASTGDYEWPNSCSTCRMMTASFPFSNAVVVLCSIAKATVLRVGSGTWSATLQQHRKTPVFHCVLFNHALAL